MLLELSFIAGLSFLFGLMVSLWLSYRKINEAQKTQDNLANAIRNKVKDNDQKIDSIDLQHLIDESNKRNGAS